MGSYRSVSTKERWPVPSKLLVNPLEEKHLGSNWLPRLPVNLLHLLEVSRSHTGTGLEPSLSVKSEDTRSLLSFSSANSHFNVLFVKLLKTSKQILGFKVQLLVLCKRPVRHIWLVCLRTLICVQSMPSVSPSCQRTFNWQDVSEENEPKLLQCNN